MKDYSIKNAAKYSDTGLRVLEVLKTLIDSPCSAEDLFKKIEDKNEVENVYTKEVLLKYFHTFRMLGFNLSKNKSDGQYCIKNVPSNLKIDRNDIDAICKIKCFVEILGQKSTIKYFDEFLSKLETFLSPEQLEMIVTREKSHEKTISKFRKYSDLLELIDECLQTRQRVKILYKNETTKKTNEYLLEPINIGFRDRSFFLVAYNPVMCEKQKFLIEKIKGITYNPQTVRENNIYNSVTFEISERFKKSYKLREDEVLINEDDEKIVISNSTEDREFLMKRLLRYGTSCKVLYPDAFRKRFLELVNTMIKNYNNA